MIIFLAMVWGLIAWGQSKWLIKTGGEYVASVAYALSAMLAAASAHYPVEYIVAIEAITFVGAWFWTTGPGWLSIFSTKFRWSPYASGVYFLPFLYMMQIVPFGAAIVLGHGAARVALQKYAPTKLFFFDIAIPAVLGILLGYRLGKGF